MSDDLDDLLREITFEPPDHLEAPPWPTDAAASLHHLPPPQARRRWSLAAVLLLAAAAAVLAVRVPQPVASEAGEADGGWPSVALDDQHRWLSDTDAIESMEQLAFRAAPMCPPPGAVASPYCMGLR